jgi:hypothetical protein
MAEVVTVGHTHYLICTHVVLLHSFVCVELVSFGGLFLNLRQYHYESKQGKNKTVGTRRFCLNRPVIVRKIAITVGWLTKKNLASLFVRCELLAVWGYGLRTMCTVIAVETVPVPRESDRGWVDRGDVGACCKPNRGNLLVQRITFCVCLPLHSH